MMTSQCTFVKVVHNNVKTGAKMYISIYILLCFGFLYLFILMYTQVFCAKADN